MPIIRYFLFVGGLLLALLFAADRYLPAPVERAGPSDPDRTIIRIASARTLPEKIVFDTRPRADLPIIAQTDPLPEDPRQQVREAMAAMPAAPAAEVKESPVRASVAARMHPKRSAKLQKRTPDRRLAFERADPFAGGWW
ncbi:MULTISPECIES: hypothetical protein [Bradyrhizobium]|uniref:Uncharacterized protein n=1 Tax=Bradyrhizobium nanningense TaxID=1325118 RepID=A0A4Q0S4R8_9BRAD|nr:MULTISPECIES: hypothetical protein [Bradyrhizobium]RXH23046.1 hypothetical protein XH84_34140 [Bradyrhizobium nanningense]RXH27086.1 hypothetical protein XH99_16760 [Bradyrhizobium nanningense]TQF31976.1 hypothetical protein UNPA324_21935 [Bradyrhizobium sp. UNPA324]